MTSSIDFLANNGSVGGGEVMLLSMAEVARDLGLSTRVVAPTQPDELVRRASAAGFTCAPIECTDRRSYFTGLAMHRRRLRADIWWCNGLLPALATAGARRRVVHLHQEPVGAQRHAVRLARVGALRTVVPSASMASVVSDSTVLHNWTPELARSEPAPSEDDVTRIGFIGRFSTIKGLDVLARALQRLDRLGVGPFRLVLAGDDRFVAGEQADAPRREVDRLPDVVRMGWVDPSAFFDAVDVVVVPSVCPETFGLVAAEAMAVGRPLVVSDAGALPEVVGPDHPWVARAGDPVDLAEVIRVLLDTSPSTRAATCDRARTRWETFFGPAPGRRRFTELLGSLGLSFERREVAP